MPGEKPFFIEGTVAEVLKTHSVKYVKVPNGNIYALRPDTPGIIFDEIIVGQRIRLEVTTMLTRVLSAKVLD